MVDETLPASARALASTLNDEYVFPAVLMVACPDGRLVHKIKLNDYLGRGRPGKVEGGWRYMEFLVEGRTKAAAVPGCTPTAATGEPRVH